MSTTDSKKSDDKTTDNKTPQEKPHRKAHARKKDPRRLLLPLFVLLLLAGIAAGVWLYQTMTRQNVQQQDAINVLREQLQTSQQNAETQINQLQKRLGQQQQAQQELRDNLSTLLKRNEHLRKDWLLGEAEYLLKLASYRLQLERDINTALRAMHIADERLRDIGDPALLTVRKLLADDQNALKNVPAADITGMSLTLSALINNIDKLPLNTPAPEQTTQQPDNQPDKANTGWDWKAIPGAIWQEVKTLVRIRQHDTKIAPLLSPKEQFYLIQNLHMQLEQARLALLLGKGSVFTERLQKAQTWLQQFFDLKDPMVQNTLQTLQQLSAVNIEPQIPSIEKSYQALKSYMADMASTQSDVKPNHLAPTTQKKPAKKTTKELKPKTKTDHSKTPDKQATKNSKVEL